MTSVGLVKFVSMSHVSIVHFILFLLCLYFGFVRKLEFFIVLKGKGMIYTDHGDKPSSEGDVVYSPRGCWHGFNNTSTEDVVLVWGWMGAGSIEDSGYEVHPESHK